MTTKRAIVQSLGEAAILLPELLNQALLANERAKLRMTVLQYALGRACNPLSVPAKLYAGLPGLGLDTSTLDKAIGTARLTDPGHLALAGGQALIEGLLADIAAMIEPVDATSPAYAEQFKTRLEDLSQALPPVEGDVISADAVNEITAARADGKDSLHRLVMDVHKAINEIAAQTASETVDGAVAQGLLAEDRQLVQAFMRGLNRTRGLAFGHPGLGTMAAKTGDRLIIQNDIGMTDAHVIVIHVEKQAVTITYTDVHQARAHFFMKLFSGKGVEWSEPGKTHKLQSGQEFLLLKGHFPGATLDGTQTFLEYLGSRLVFMIDWNKGRKALRNFVSDGTARDILLWAARHDHGHRAFLELGGAEAIYQAVRHAGPDRVPYGARLEHVLGAGKTTEFLKSALKVASEGLLAGRSSHLLMDEIQALLSAKFESLEIAYFAVVIRHLGVSRMITDLIGEGISGNGLASDRVRADLAKRSRQLEHKADKLTVEARDILQRFTSPKTNLRGVIEAAEDANDAIEDVAFLVSLFSEVENGEIFSHCLGDLLHLAKACIGELVRAVDASSVLSEGLQADVTDALQAVERILELERKADDALRETMARFVTALKEPRTVFIGIEAARAMEVCTDHVSRSALALRDSILSGLKV